MLKIRRLLTMPVAALSALFSSSLFATPVVDGHLITWTDPGWHQVLDVTNDFQEACQGGRECLVPEGRYLVINLTTGERFENIVVTGAPLPLENIDSSADDSVQINGNVISWPDDGWYQVQDASNFSSVCEGGLSCNVPAGTYHVINLTLGIRHENLQVLDTVSLNPPTDTPSSNVNVAGNLISWSESGWFQVQNASTFETLCEGGSNCEVSPGTYNVINLSSGTRYEGVVVSSGAEEPPPSPTSVFALDAVAQDLMVSLSGNQLEDMRDILSELVPDIIGTNTGTSLPGDVVTTDDPRMGRVDTMRDRTRYNCNGMSA